MTGRALQVLATGPLALLQDRGRPGLADVGVGRSGAADRAAFGLGARLLGQDLDRAAIEVTLGGLAVRALGDLWLALTGAPTPAAVDGVGVGYAAPFAIRAGQTLRLGRPEAGLRSYLSVRGGLAVPAVLGSRATDTLSGVGPAPLTVGEVLPVGPAPADFPGVDVAPVAPPGAGPVTVRVTPGPRADWLADPEALAGTEWTVSARSDRVGVRLEGEPLARHPARRDTELPSEGVVLGAVQVPPGGEPVVFLADHPVTGGYPVVAVVRDDDVDLLAQVLPGQRVRVRLAG